MHAAAAADDDDDYIKLRALEEIASDYKFTRFF